MNAVRGAVLAEIQETAGAYKPRKWKPRDGLRCGRVKVVVVERERKTCTVTKRRENTIETKS